MAIHAANYRLFVQRRDEARNIAISSHTSYWMERRAIWLNSQAQVVKVILSQGPGHWLVRAIAVTSQANFVRFVCWIRLDATKRHAANVERYVSGASRGAGRVRVVAIGTLHVARIRDSRLGRVVHERSGLNRMRGYSVEIGLKIVSSNIAVVAVDAVVFFGRVDEQPGTARFIVRNVTILAPVIADRIVWAAAPRIRRRTVPGRRRKAVRRLRPTRFLVALDADL
jgi:hypothetical protein